MTKFLRPLLFLTLILCACSINGPATEAIPLDATEAPSVSSITPPVKFIATFSTPHIDQPPDGFASETPNPTYGGCGYMWAYRPLPEISEQFQQAVAQIEPGSQADAYAFGEDCIHADGHATFSALETDFNVTLAVNDLNDKNALGIFIRNVMRIVTVQFPRGVVPGAQNGFVQFTFTRGEERIGLRASIDAFNHLPAGLNGAELYDALASSQ